ncbi:PREDICTED: uncharacterized protein LOC108364969 [Rhagoletis zephyria]|uniref:uncharacterized protein LOC108364969 n=1 Tax=Rhagoletis zephyria TaxID=28612 RepID=UPI0008116E6B|nr:PREDICTED: uncharacterized protein LOC108364969 [Rhagoletis zephyria]
MERVSIFAMEFRRLCCCDLIYVHLGISGQCSSTYMPSHDVQSVPSQCPPTELTLHADFAWGSDQDIAIPKELLLSEGFGRSKLLLEIGKRLFNEPRYINEVCVDDVATPRRAKRVIDMMKNALQKKIIEL